MTLEEKCSLCYVSSGDLSQWMTKNNLRTENFIIERAKWEKEINKKPNFFSDTELLLVWRDNLLLRAVNEIHASFLVKTYKLEYQKICQAVFQTKKNVMKSLNSKKKINKNRKD